jgi:hypothetical protein
MLEFGNWILNAECLILELDAERSMLELLLKLYRLNLNFFFIA